MRGPQTFKRRDLTRLLECVTQTGHKVERIKMDREGNLDIVILNGENPSESPADDWDKALANDC